MRVKPAKKACELLQLVILFSGSFQNELHTLYIGFGVPMWTQKGDGFLSSEVLNCYSVGGLQKGKPLRSEEWARKERDFDSSETLERVEEVKEARDQKHFRLARKAEPGIVSEDEAKPWSTE